MSEWTYSDINGPTTYPPCPVCTTARGVYRNAGMNDRYHCTACMTSFTARRTSSPLADAHRQRDKGQQS